jgi:hypothetical protein
LTGRLFGGGPFFAVDRSGAAAGRGAAGGLTCFGVELAFRVGRSDLLSKRRAGARRRVGLGRSDLLRVGHAQQVKVRPASGRACFQGRQVRPAFNTAAGRGAAASRSEAGHAQQVKV